ncbi:unnamed protein product [Scytosiphon promiscuus]
MLREQSDARDAMAEPCLRRSLEIHEKMLGPDHPEVATDLSNLAEVLQDNGEIEHAEPLHRRALEIRLRHLGPEHNDVAFSLHNLSLVYRARGDHKEAARYMARANDIWEMAYPKPPAGDAAAGGDAGAGTAGAGTAEQDSFASGVASGNDLSSSGTPSMLHVTAKHARTLSHDLLLASLSCGPSLAKTLAAGSTGLW